MIATIFVIIAPSTNNYFQHKGPIHTQRQMYGYANDITLHDITAITYECQKNSSQTDIIGNGSVHPRRPSSALQQTGAATQSAASHHNPSPHRPSVIPHQT